MLLLVAGLGSASALQGQLAEGCALLEEASSESIRTGGLRSLTYRVVWLSEVCRLAGRGEEAWQHARQALDLARQHSERAPPMKQRVGTSGSGSLLGVRKYVSSPIIALVLLEVDKPQKPSRPSCWKKIISYTG
jgi:hypothetical protein